MNPEPEQDQPAQRTIRGSSNGRTRGLGPRGWGSIPYPRVSIALAVVFTAGFLASSSFPSRSDDPRPGSRRALAVAELIEACNWMHTSTKLHGLGYSIAHVQRTHVYRALVIMGGVWPTTTTTPTTTALSASPGTRTGPGSGTGSGPGTGVPTPSTG